MTEGTVFAGGPAVEPIAAAGRPPGARRPEAIGGRYLVRDDTDSPPGVPRATAEEWPEEERVAERRTPRMDPIEVDEFEEDGVKYVRVRQVCESDPDQNQVVMIHPSWAEKVMQWIREVKEEIERGEGTSSEPGKS
jgi:hypothetical protein